MPDIFTSQPKKEDKEESPAEEVRPERPRELHFQDNPVQGQAAKEPAAKLSSSLPHHTEGTTPGLFSSYCPHPRGLIFMNQEPDEKLLLFLRRHFITNVPWIFFTVIFLLVPPLFFVTINFSNISFFSVPPQMIFILVAFYYLLVANYALGKFIVWFYHIGIITPKRLLDLDVDNILHYHLAETELRDVVDVAYSQKGFFQSFFNFGDVPIQTEAIKANFEFEQTPHPSKVADIVTDLRPQLKGKVHHDA